MFLIEGEYFMTTLRRDMTFLMAILVAGTVFFAGCGKHEKKDSKKIASLETTEVQGQADNLKVAHAGDVLQDEQVDESLFADQGQEMAQLEGEDFEAADDFEMAELDADDVIVDEDDKVFETLHFAFNDSGVLPEEREALDRNIEAARAATAEGHKVVIQGHCDQLGSPAYNLALSVERANAIKNEMVKQGISEASVEVVGVGSEMPLVWSDSQDRDQKITELAANRRAEISVI
jgi:outer membrane protein OmpA-like peptidoglycan-associated protein